MTLKKGTLFPEELITDVINGVKGKSSLVKLSNQAAIPFNGNEVFTFTMDNEIDVVAESGKKSHGGVKLTPQKMAPIKVEYGARVSDEFIYASDEAKINILESFVVGFSRKLAKGLDLMAMHGINPRTGTLSTVIGTNHFDAKVTKTVEYNAAEPDETIQKAVSEIQLLERDVNGVVLSPVLSTALAEYKVNGVKQFPEFAWGQVPSSANGLQLDVNSTVSYGVSTDRAIVGDFDTAFKWGYAKQIPMEVIEYGDPDNSGNDLKGSNEVYIRCEAYLGWGILDNDAFARIVEA